jgi:hypothetical protein
MPLRDRTIRAAHMLRAPQKRIGEPRAAGPEPRPWCEELTAAEMEKCRWLRPWLVATIDYLERMRANHLRHVMFTGADRKFGVQSPQSARRSPGQR